MEKESLWQAQEGSSRPGRHLNPLYRRRRLSSTGPLGTPTQALIRSLDPADRQLYGRSPVRGQPAQGQACPMSSAAVCDDSTAIIGSPKDILHLVQVLPQNLRLLRCGLGRCRVASTIPWSCGTAHRPGPSDRPRADHRPPAAATCGRGSRPSAACHRWPGRPSGVAVC